MLMKSLIIDVMLDWTCNFFKFSKIGIFKGWRKPFSPQIEF